jgi:hypothetical protein
MAGVAGRRHSRSLIIVLIVVALVALLAGLFYFATPADKIPSWLPGRVATSSAHHVRRATALVGVGVLCAAAAWIVARRPGWVAAPKRALASAPPWLRVAGAAYAVVALFGLAYLVVSVTWSDLSSGATATVAGLIAAPVALGLIWPRLTALQAFGIQVSLTPVTVQLDTKLAAAIMSPDIGSRAPDLVKQMEAIVQPGTELLEVNLRDGSYWWSTRLYLLAALAHDMSDIHAFVFVRGGADRRFVGMAPPADVRRALAKQTPELETTYLAVAQKAPAESRVPGIVLSWTARSFGPKDEPERDFASRVSPEELNAALARIERHLNSDSVDWPGYAGAKLIRALVREFSGEYVALLRCDSLDRMVNRHALAVEIAAGVE